MFDTIYIELPYQNLRDLENTSDTVDSETGEVKYSVGYSGCIKVRKARGRLIIECCLPKLLKGNNIYSLTYLETVAAFKLIEKKLGISIQEGIIRRLDCEYTLETKLKPKEYFRYFGDFRYLTRSNINCSSLYYSSKSRIFNFYDKIKEIKTKREIVPEEYVNKNLMRCEFRYKNQSLKEIAKKLSLGMLKIEDLINTRIYLGIAEIVYTDYNSITKIKESYFDFTTLNSKTKFQEQLLFDGIEVNGGLNSLLDKIDASRPFNPDLPSSYFSRRKKEIREIMNCKKHNNIANCIDEVNKKIEKSHFATLNQINERYRQN